MYKQGSYFHVVLLIFSFSFICLGQLNITLDYTLYGDKPYFDVVVELDPGMSSPDEFYADVSFPLGITNAEILDQNDWGNAGVYPAGELIYDKDGNQIVSEYLLVSAWVSPSTGYQDLRLEIRVYPNICGEIPIYYRGSQFNGIIVVKKDPEFSPIFDQQGFPVKEERLLYKYQLPDITIIEISVNDGNEVMEGDIVEISAKIAELQGFIAGQILAYFYVDGELVGDDNTEALMGFETGYAKIDHKFDTPGTFQIEVKADPEDDLFEDNENNNESSVPIDVKENQAPTVSINSPVINGSTVQLSWTGIDPEGHNILYRYKLDNDPWSLWSSDKQKMYTDLAFGSYTFYVQCKDSKDKVGNTDSKPFSTINNPPTVSINTPVINDYSIQLTWSGIDPEGHNILYSYKLDNDSWSSWSSSKEKTYTDIASGSYTFYVKCKDEYDLVGNTDNELFTEVIAKV